PAAYMKICALLVPREMKLEHSGGVKAMTDEQIEDAIAAIKAWMAAQAGEAAKVIEGGAEVAPSLPAPARPTKASGMVALVRFLQKSLKRSGAISVYRTVCRMFLCPR